MIMADVMQQLKILQNRHAADTDGGYALVADIRDFSRKLDDLHARLLLREALLQFIVEPHSGMAGVALEVLVQEKATEIGPKLADYLTANKLSQEWQGHLYLALLRLGYKPIEDSAIVHISERLAKGDTTVFPLLAALVHINQTKCMSISADAFANQYEHGTLAKLQGYLSAFVLNCEDIDLMLIAILVERVSERNKDAGWNLASMFLRYVDQTYVRNRLGVDKLAEVRSALCGIRDGGWE